jgi:hypothetical protein
MSYRNPAVFIAFVLMFTLQLWAQKTTPASTSTRPQKSVKKTIEQAIKALESYDCVTVAVDFLNPIRRAQIPDMEEYRTQRHCSPQDKGNLDDVLLALRLARLVEPEYKGITATINLEGVGLKIEKITLMKYLDGRWYFSTM